MTSEHNKIPIEISIHLPTRAWRVVGLGEDDWAGMDFADTCQSWNEDHKLDTFEYRPQRYTTDVFNIDDVQFWIDEFLPSNLNWEQRGVSRMILNAKVPDIRFDDVGIKLISEKFKICREIPHP